MPRCLNFEQFCDNVRGYRGRWDLGDGYVGTSEYVKHDGPVEVHVALWIKNTAESTNYVPQFIVAFNFVTDNCMLRALQIDGGRQFWFTNCWFENTSTPLPSNQGFNDVEAVLING